MIQPTVAVTKPPAYLIDGMALVQKLKVDYLTFGEIAEKILPRVLREGEGSNRVYAVFDVYRDIPLKHRTQGTQFNSYFNIQFE